VGEGGNVNDRRKLTVYLTPNAATFVSTDIAANEVDNVIEGLANGARLITIPGDKTVVIPSGSILFLAIEKIAG
jgi:hypothetical protein